MKRRVFWPALILASLLFITACEQPAGTGGDSKISLADAQAVAKIGVDDEYPLNGIYVLTADVTLANWTPIGTVDEPFAGTFDGGNKTITIAGGGGLFGFAEGALIRNVLVAGTINVAGEMTTHAGGIVGFAEKTKIISCVSSANVTVEGQGHNSSAGGIAGTLSKDCVVADCYATGDIVLKSGEDKSLMLYAGGIAGYQGLSGASAGGEGGCVIERCYFTGNVTAEGGYPYAGGLVGDNYAGAALRESYAAGGTVTARGENLPYAGGLVGYNSRSSSVENCYSDMTVNAVAGSKRALAGGVAGANAADAVIATSYARGAVTATVDGGSAKGAGGSMGVPDAANAGGIAGAQYVGVPTIENCVALNTKVEGGDSGSDAVYNVHRIAGMGTTDDAVWKANIANVAALAKGGVAFAPESDPAGHDGGDCAATPEQSAYEGLGWDFEAVWEMAGNYPVLRWEK
jgi:hypothetical protein